MIESHHSLFHGLDRVKIVEVESMLRPFHAAAGELVYRDGESPPGLYFIDDGYVEVHHSSLEQETLPELKNVRGSGDYFGEMALLDRRRRHTTVTAIEKVKGRFFPEDSFNRFIEREPRLLLNLTRDVISRNTQHDSELIRELIRAKNAAETFIDRLKALTVTSQIINSTLDLDTLLNLILKEALKNTGSDTGTIYLVDEEAGELHSRVLDKGMVKEIRLPLGQGLAGHVAKTGEVVNIRDAYSDERFNPEIDKKTGYKTETVLTAPMRDPDRRIVGVLQLINKEAGPFTIQDERFIDTMGTQASIALEKARLAEYKVRTESLAAVGRLAATIIHDFKNPMTIIRGYAQLLEHPHKDEERKEYLQVIMNQIDRLVGMTQEVLDFSRGETSVHYSTLPLGPFFEDLAETVQHDLDEREIGLVMETPAGDTKASFDPDRMTRVFYNLTGNARDAIGDKGTIHVKVSVDGARWMLEVQDDGPGIPEERRAQIFEPFATFDKERGTGLGLAITQKIVEEHEGEILLESEVGEGTTFTLSFPLKPKGSEE